MLIIRCPYCLEQRSEEELLCGGEADINRPSAPAEVSDEVWTDYLYMRLNTKGIHREQWCCSAGCGQWFKVQRDTVTHEVIEVIRLDERFSREMN